MQIVVPNISKSKADKLDRVYRYAVDKNQMKRFQYMLRQVQIKRAVDALNPERYSPLGEFIGAIDLHTYLQHEINRPGCMGDETYIKEFLRDNPECRGAKVQKKLFNGWSGR